MNDKSKKKKIIVGSLTAFVILVGALAIIFINNIKKELQEVARIEQEENDKALKEQQEQEEKERQERLAKYETEWSLLEDGQQYLTLGSNYFKRVEKHDNGLYTYKISEEFVGTLYSIVDGFYNGASMEDLSVILNGALASLPDNATGKEVYDAFVDYADTVDRDEVVTGEGDMPMDVLTPTTNTQTSNGGTGTSGGGSGTGGNGTGGSNTSGGGGGSTTNANNGGSSTTSSDSSGDEINLDNIFAGNDPTLNDQDPDDHKAGSEGGLGTGGN